MIAVTRCYKHTTPLVVEVFEKCDEQSQKDAVVLAALLGGKYCCGYKVFLALSCAGVVGAREPFQK